MTKMTLEVIRDKLKEKKAQLCSDPDTEEKYTIFIKESIDIFDNEDAIRLLSTPQIMAVIHFLGYSIPEAKEMALEIEKEVNRKYYLVDPDRFSAK